MFSIACRTGLIRLLASWRFVEPPWNTHTDHKAWTGATHFTMKTRERVGTERSLQALAYNIKRVLKIMGVQPLAEGMNGDPCYPVLAPVQPPTGAPGRSKEHLGDPFRIVRNIAVETTLKEVVEMNLCRQLCFT